MARKIKARPVYRWFRFDAFSWIDTTAGMSLAERGMYTTLLAHQWTGVLLADDGKLASQLGVDKRTLVRFLKEHPHMFPANAELRQNADLEDLRPPDNEEEHGNPLGPK